MMTLYSLPLDHAGKIEEIRCSQFIKRRLFDLGLVPGTIIYSLFKSPLGDPIAYEFRGNIIALRSDETKNILLSSNYPCK